MTTHRIANVSSAEDLNSGFYLLPSQDKRATTREEESLDLTWVFSILRQRLPWIIGAAVISLALAFLYIVMAKPKYVATAEILIETKRPKITDGAAIFPGIFPDLDLGRFMVTQVINSQVETIRSRRVAERVINDLHRDGISIFDDDEVMAPKDSKDAPADGKPPAAESAAEAPAEKPDMVSMTDEQFRAFGQNLDVRRYQETLIIRVSYTDRNKERAAVIANAVASTYLAEQLEAQSKTKQQAFDWLNARVAELLEQVRTAERRIEDYKSENDLVESGGQLLHELELSETLAKLTQARADAGLALANLRQSERGALTPDTLSSMSTVLQSAVIADFRRQHAQIKRKLALLVSRYGENHPEVVNGKAELKDLQREIQQEVNRLVEGSRSAYQVARNREEILEKQVAALKVQVGKLKRLKIGLDELKRDAKATGDLYTQTLARLKETQGQASLHISDTRLVDEAKPPEFSSWPRKDLILGAALTGSVGLSVVLILLHELITKTIRSARMIRTELDAPHIASLPLVPSSRGVPRFVLGNDASQYAQAIFMIKNLLRREFHAQQNGVVVAIVSALKGEGRTTTALNLADYASMSDFGTLLIDCDLRNFALTKFLAPDAASSIDDIVSNGAKLEDVILQDQQSGFDLCPAPNGTDLKRPMDVLASSQMERFLQDARSKYDLILLDTSPLLSFVDAQALLESVDFNVVLVENGRTSVSQAQEVIELASDTSKKRIGVVLNKA
ncbi:MAG: GumC family protein [Methyloligellaceae bacterium]